MIVFILSVPYVRSMCWNFYQCLRLGAFWCMNCYPVKCDESNLTLFPAPGKWAASMRSSLVEQGHGLPAACLDWTRNWKEFGIRGVKKFYLLLWTMGQIYIFALNSKIRYFAFSNSQYRMYDLRR